MNGLIIGICGLKGGSTRTTSSMYLAAAAHKQDHKVIVIDADNEGSALNWSKGASLPFEVIQMTSLDELEDQATEYKQQGYMIIIDGMPNAREQLFTIAMCSDVALVPTSATGTDVNRLKPTLAILSKVEKGRREAITSILLTRYDRRRKLTKEFLDIFVDYPILNSKVSNKAIYQSEFGAIPTYTREYSDVLHEVLENEQ